MRDKVGRKAYEVVWGALCCEASSGQHYDEISMTWLWGKIYLRVASRGKPWEKEKLGYPMGSFGEVFDRLGERIRELGGEVHISRGVNAIDFRDDRGRRIDVRLYGRRDRIPGLRRHNRHHPILRFSPDWRPCCRSPTRQS